MNDITQPTLTLPQLVDRMLELLAVVDECDGEVTPEIEAEFDALAPDLDAKAAAYSAVYRALEGQAAGDAAMAEMFTRRKERKLARRDALKRRLFDEMTRLGVRKLGGSTGGATIQKSAPALVLRANEVAIMQAGFRKTVESVDRQVLRAAVEKGDAAAMELAALEQSEHVRFR